MSRDITDCRQVTRLYTLKPERSRYILSLRVVTLGVFIFNQDKIADIKVTYLAVWDQVALWILRFIHVSRPICFDETRWNLLDGLVNFNAENGKIFRTFAWGGVFFIEFRVSSRQPGEHEEFGPAWYFGVRRAIWAGLDLGSDVGLRMYRYIV